MYCMNCGADCPDTEQLCANCKQKLNIKNSSNSKQSSKENPAAPQDNMDKTDTPSWIYAIVGFIFPLIGLILYLVWRIQTPRRAKSVGKGTLLGAVTLIVLYAVTFVLYIAPAVTNVIKENMGSTQQNPLAANLKFIPSHSLTRQSGEEGTIEIGEENFIYDEEDVLLDGTYIESAVAQTQQEISGSEEYSISIRFNDEGTKIFQKITRDLTNEQLCILYNDKVICAPIITSEIAGGEAIISGGFQNSNEALELAEILSH